MKPPSYILGETAAKGAPSLAMPTLAQRESMRRLAERGRIGVRPYSLQFAAREATFAEDGTVKVMAIRMGAGNPTDGRYYDDNFIASIVPLLAGADCFFNHASAIEDRDRPERDVKEKAGWFSDPYLGKWTDPKVPNATPVAAAFATFHPRVGDDLIASMLQTAREKFAKYPAAAPFVAWSINAFGAGARGDVDGKPYDVISLCSELASVDLVTYGGAGGTLAFTESAAIHTTTPTSARVRLSPSLAAARQAAREAKAPNWLRCPR